MDQEGCVGGMWLLVGLLVSFSLSVFVFVFVCFLI